MSAAIKVAIAWLIPFALFGSCANGLLNDLDRVCCMCALVSCLVHLQIISIFLVQDVLAFGVILVMVTP